MCLPCPAPHVLTMHRQSDLSCGPHNPRVIPSSQDVQHTGEEPMTGKAQDLVIRPHPWSSPRRALAAAMQAGGRGERGGREGRSSTCLCNAHFGVGELDFPDADLDVLKFGNDACSDESDIIVWKPHHAARYSASSSDQRATKIVLRGDVEEGNIGNEASAGGSHLLSLYPLRIKSLSNLHV